MDNAESMEEHVARAKSLVLNVNYHGIEIKEQAISRRVLNGLPPAYTPEKRNFALKTGFSLGGLEGGLVRVEELNRSLDGTTAAMPRPPASKLEVAGRGGGAGDVEAAMAADAARATVKGRPQHQPQQ